MDNLKDTLNVFKNPKSKVSCHWLITKRGILYKVVDESNAAWHAGVSYWRGERNLNNNSIGIELENQGHGRGYKSFTNSQLIILEALIKRILGQYKLKIINVLGHSDIAPERKFDPGELFDWERLAKKKLAFWPKVKRYEKKERLLQVGEKNREIYSIKRKLIKIGYKSSNNSYYVALEDVPGAVALSGTDANTTTLVNTTKFRKVDISVSEQGDDWSYDANYEYGQIVYF